MLQSSCCELVSKFLPLQGHKQLGSDYVTFTRCCELVSKFLPLQGHKQRMLLKSCIE